MIGISTRQLEVFVTVATTGSIKLAAQRLHVTQPAVSMGLADLEKQLGTPLFDRLRGRLVLNARGHDVLPKAREIVERLRELTDHTTTDPALKGDLRIGASNTIGNYRVGDLLGTFMQNHPGVALHVDVINTKAIAERLLDHTLDIGAIEGPLNDSRLDVMAWREDRLLVCAAPRHPLAQRSSLSPGDFLDAHWILREPGSAMRVQTEQALARLARVNVVLELGQVEAIKQAVIAGLGLACLPEAALHDALQTGRLVVLPTPFLTLSRTLAVVVHKSRYRGALVNAFLQSLKTGQTAFTNQPLQSGSTCFQDDTDDKLETPPL